MEVSFVMIQLREDRDIFRNRVQLAIHQFGGTWIGHRSGKCTEVIKQTSCVRWPQKCELAHELSERGRGQAGKQRTVNE